MDLTEVLKAFLDEDVGDGDITSEAVVEPGQGKGRMVAKEAGMVAGIEEVCEVFRMVGCTPSGSVADGDEVTAGTTVLEVEGEARDILKGERLALNILSRMSGIATATAHLVHVARMAKPDVEIAATRKTTPGFRYFEKKAVEIGGGVPHRWGLNDAILIKENHIEMAGSITEAVERAMRAGHDEIEIEVTSSDEALEAAAAGADVVMLDNFTPRDANWTYNKLGLSYPMVKVEISGGIDAENIADYAFSADRISVGGLTHSVKAIDFSMYVTR